jgi:DNA topoisomerase-1
MTKTLVIIESTGSKIKKLSTILGPKYIVKASMGHINELRGKGEGVSYSDDLYKLNYDIIKRGSKGKNISSLKALVKSKEIGDVIIATDRDREGEAIGFHICNYIGLDISKIKRLIFNSIDKKTILNAIENPSKIDLNIVHEQMGRAGIDYLIGFGISPVVSRKLRKMGLSAGRVQSVVLKMIIDKEMELIGYDSKRWYTVNGKFMNGDVELVADLKKKFMVIKEDGEEGDKEKDEEESNSGKMEVNKFLEDCLKAEFKLGKLNSVKKNTKPPAPYITSTFIQDAGKKFGTSSKGAMSIAQKLYEDGKITYMRTDCTYIIPEFQELIGQYVEEKWGKEYVECRQYQSTDKNAQEAHECIRITDVGTEKLGDEYEEFEKKLYRMIWERTVASQMSKKESRHITVPIRISNREEIFEAKAEEVLFDGYTIVYKKEGSEEKKEEKVKVLKELVEGSIIAFKEIIANEKRGRPSPRYDDITITKTMEKMGIGRPSTYSSMCPKLLDRGYIVQDTRDVLPKTVMNRLYIEAGNDVVMEKEENVEC